jgi:hypothetical protein
MILSPSISGANASSACQGPLNPFHSVSDFLVCAHPKSQTDVSMKSDICVHKMQRARCFKCGGKGLCTHGRQRNRCSECGGKGLCKHARRKEDCKECSTKLFCVHRRRSYSCVDCGGAGTCEHKAIRSTCKQCGGGGICKHGRRRYRCKQCNVPASKEASKSHSDRSNAGECRASHVR